MDIVVQLLVVVEFHKVKDKVRVIVGWNHMGMVDKESLHKVIKHMGLNHKYFEWS